MQRSDVRELHYITAVANVASILVHGICSQRRIKRLGLAHVTIAQQGVQEQRANNPVRTAGSYRSLHHYANLYVHARNAMLYGLLQTRRDLTVLGVDPCVLDLNGVLVSDRNAAAFTRRVFSAADGIAHLDAEVVFAKAWDHSRDAKQRRMAEVLVPDRVPASMIRRAYMPDQLAVARLRDQLGEHDLLVGSHPFLFFSRSSQ
ncbi:MAG: DUF4433 domain-containing protein [Egibacteraceae bacterium]